MAGKRRVRPAPRNWYPHRALGVPVNTIQKPLIKQGQMQFPRTSNKCSVVRGVAVHQQSPTMTLSAAPKMPIMQNLWPKKKPNHNR